MPYPKLSIVPPVIAHRGARCLAPENTLAAFRKVKETGAKWVEFDVMLASCGEAIVIHDDTLDRTTNGHGPVADYSYDYLQSLDAGSWFNPIFCDEKIPTFADVLRVLSEYQLAANIEIKPAPGLEDATVHRVLQLLDQYWPSENAVPLISSFSREVLYALRKQAPHCQIGFLMHEWQPDWQEHCDRLEAMTVNVNEAILTPQYCREIKQSQRMLLAYTVNDLERTRELLSQGVDAVFTDCPEKLVPFLR